MKFFARFAIATVLLAVGFSDALAPTSAIRNQRNSLVSAMRSRGGALKSSNDRVFPIPTKESVAQAKDVVKTSLPLSNKAAVGMGMVLAFNAGVINCASLSGLLAVGTKQASAAVTGAWTNSAIGAATLFASSGPNAAAASQFLFNAKCIICYLFGSVISGFVIPEPKAFEIDVPKSVSLFTIAAGLLASASYLARASNMNYLFLCCLATGLQNSFTSTTTANLCRTCHFSGITSDMGTFIGQALGGNKANVQRLKNVAMIAASFWIGGFLSLGWTKKFGGLVLLGTAVVDLAFAGYLGLKKSSQ
mmetsp:Transcript_23485/g.65194  ORF Transcript_23485/g.65194 Transcript_23485/m.65194 type:complete len:305 (+) Transcript_23485:178-1092(+)|eukprot:CAMPEP_0172369318 /NCGR_PEP_ID=MMETSP1060-20121228/32107_1 /TAXON_ID=37318 /ORGANISM="Pseudo-nitzschia pungens, Strain cf. cingulata" /LENGTH=304 /DNA_ID=CAMNT_0013094199 /DNA_START=69 /DNA_END=983 /DNA_ORIENTATION=-